MRVNNDVGRVPEDSLWDVRDHGGNEVVRENQTEPLANSSKGFESQNALLRGVDLSEQYANRHPKSATRAQIELAGILGIS